MKDVAFLTVNDESMTSYFHHMFPHNACWHEVVRNAMQRVARSLIIFSSQSGHCFMTGEHFEVARANTATRTGCFTSRHAGKTTLSVGVRASPRGNSTQLATALAHLSVT